MSERIRAFVALELPDDLKERLQSAQATLHAGIGYCVRWVKPKQIHLTLRFLGSIPANSAPIVSQALAGARASTRPFELRAAGFGCFPNERRPRVIWAALTGALNELVAVQAGIDEAVGSFAEHKVDRAFHPHLTIGRIRLCSSEQACRLAATLRATPSDLLGTWRVTHVEFYQSRLSPHGAIHEVISSAKLGG